MNLQVSQSSTGEEVLGAISEILTAEEMKDRVKKGLAISDLRRAAVKMGYLSTIGTMSFRDLSQSKVPLVVGISFNGYDHFVVYRPPGSSGPVISPSPGTIF